jgi:hypothetical protein
VTAVLIAGDTALAVVVLLVAFGLLDVIFSITPLSTNGFASSAVISLIVLALKIVPSAKQTVLTALYL